MTSLPIAALLSAVSSLALGLTFAYLWWSVLRRRYVLWLAVGRLLQLPVMFLMGLQVDFPENRLITAAVLGIAALSLVIWVLACTDFVHRPLSPWALIGVFLVVALATVLGHGFGRGFMTRELPAAATETVVFIWTAWLLLRYAPPAPGRRILAGLVALRGLHELDYPLLANVSWGVAIGLTLSTFFAVAISVFFLILILHEALTTAEQAVAVQRGTEERYRAIFDTAAVGVALIDREGRYLEANSAMCHFLGYSEAELQKRTYRDVTPADDLPEIDRQFAEMVRGSRDLIRLEKSYRRKDGAIVHGDLSVSAVRGHGGALEHTISVVEDVTDRHVATTERAEALRALRESEARSSAAFEQAAVGLCEVSPDGRFVRVNPRLCDMLGYSEAELTGRRTADVTHPDDQAQDAAWLANPASNVYHRQKRYLQKDGSIVWAQLTATLVRDPDGSPKFYLSVIEDITDRRTLEEQLLHSQKLEALGRLAGGVAHDFNNILSAVVGYTDLVRQSLPENDPRHEDLQEVLRASDRASGLVRQLLAFARKQAIEPRVVRLDEVLRNMEPMLRRLIGADVQFELRVAATTPTVRVDPGRFEQVVMNLAINARDAMPSGGRLTIETEDVWLDEEYVHMHPGSRVGRHAMVGVTDTGAGMSPEVRARIFEPFFTTKPPGQGSGLGLATSYGIVRQAGGSIWLYTEPGLGTTFRIYFPVAEGQADAAEPVLLDAAAVQGTETILLVEDDAAVRTMVERVLSAAGHRVLVASDGLEALDVARAHKGTIHLLLTDVVMPRLGGTQLATALRSDRKDLKVVFISGYSEEGAARLGDMGRGTAYVTKPFSIANLARRVRQVLDDGATERRT